MNQRSGNSSRNPAMPFNQLVERRNGRRIAQHHGDLSATGNAGGLALGAGLWLDHGLGGELAHVNHALCVRLPAGQLLGHRLAAFFRGGCNGKQSLFNCDPDKLAGLGADGGSQFAALGKGLVHGLLQSGPIPLMCESYTVTSDNATTILQVVK
jgi:hypothetical protein